MRFVVPLIFVGIVVYYCVTVWIAFNADKTGTVWERLLEAGAGSATKLWAKFVTFIGAGIGALASSADFFGSPEVSAAIKQYLQPDYVAAALVVIAFITQLARNRTLDR